MHACKIMTILNKLFSHLEGINAEKASHRLKKEFNNVFPPRTKLFDERDGQKLCNLHRWICCSAVRLLNVFLESSDNDDELFKCTTAVD